VCSPSRPDHAIYPERGEAVGRGEGSLVVADPIIILVKQPLVHNGRRLPHPPQGWGGGSRYQMGGRVWPLSAGGERNGEVLTPQG
jgi:hypothetical protein